MLDRSCGVSMASNMRSILVSLTILVTLISLACAADAKGLLGIMLKETGKVIQAQLDVDKYAIKDLASVLQQAANACL